MTTNIILAIMLVIVIALGGICFAMFKMIEEMQKTIKIHNEWISTATNLFETISNEQDKGLFRLKVAEERILNLQNRTGQIQIKLRQMDNNTIYEVKDAE